MRYALNSECPLPLPDSWNAIDKPRQSIQAVGSTGSGRDTPGGHKQREAQWMQQKNEILARWIVCHLLSGSLMPVYCVSPEFTILTNYYDSRDSVGWQFKHC